jgi:copper/silver efflux system protein
MTEMKEIMQTQDAIIMTVPEVAQVLGKVGKAETSTDPAPVNMVESIILLKPKGEWRKGLTKNDLIAELDAKLQIPGVRNGWTQPIINRINMLATGVRTDLGVKIYGPDLDTLESLAIKAEEVLRTVPGAADLYAERTQGGIFLDIAISREAVARYGITVGDVQDVIETGLGGENLGMVLDGRMRFPIRVRFGRDWRSTIENMKEILVPVKPRGAAAPMATPDGGAMAGMATQQPEARPVRPSTAYVPLRQLADLRVIPGPPMISSENAQLRSIVFLNVRGRDMGSFVGDARLALDTGLKLPAGYSLQWSGQWENQVRAKHRLQVLMPVVFLAIFVMLYLSTKNVIEALVVMLSVPFALIGGVYLTYALGYNLSVAVWVGFIALYGVAVQTGVVMVVYLHEALDRKLRAAERGERGPVTEQDIEEATVEGSVLRLRPKIMTVATALIGLIPIMWSTGVGADVMKPLAAPMIGGLVTSTIHVLVVTPLLFLMMKKRALRKGTLKASRMTI